MLPNGETVVSRVTPRKAKPSKIFEDVHFLTHLQSEAGNFFGWPEVLQGLGPLMGLSLLTNFDRVFEWAPRRGFKLSSGRTPYGHRGLTSLGAQKVRNAVYLLEASAGKARCVFATCTVPDLPRHVLDSIHQNWHKAVEIYRLNIRRALQDAQLSGEIVTVTEVQEKRYEGSGLPVLHVHAVFVGVTKTGQFAITRKFHDEAWRRALSSAARLQIKEVKVACNLQRVKHGTARYLAKYMSKGAETIASIAGSEFISWIPKQWWSCSRLLARRIDNETRCIDSLAYWLIDAKNIESMNLWAWHKEVLITLDSGETIHMATIGKLTDRVRDMVHKKSIADGCP